LLRENGYHFKPLCLWLFDPVHLLLGHANTIRQVFLQPSALDLQV
jgi:hypothetical protein